MTGTGMYIPSGHAEWTAFEAKIHEVLDQTTEEMARAECFNQEQRAEVYAILQAMKLDTANHRQMVELLAKKLCKGTCDA